MIRDRLKTKLLAAAARRDRRFQLPVNPQVVDMPRGLSSVDMFPMFGGNDRYHLRPHLPKSSEVVFVGIATVSALHALSLLQDVTPVSKCIFFDINEQQLFFFRRAVALLGQSNGDRVEYLEKLYGIKFGSKVELESADVTNAAATLRVPTVTVEQQQQGPARLELLTGGPPVHDAPLLASIALAGRDGMGYDYGHLEETEFPVKCPGAEFFLGPATEICEKVIADYSDCDVVLWLSNASGYPPHKQLDSGLPAAIPAWTKQPNTHVWISPATSSTVGEGNPHRHVITNINNTRLPGHMIQVYPHETADRLCKEYPNAENWGWREYLEGQPEATTVMLHIVSLVSLAVLRGIWCRARELSQRVIVLEHNALMCDTLPGHNDGISRTEIRKLFGVQETWFRWSAGFSDLRRNMLLGYDKPGS